MWFNPALSRQGPSGQIILKQWVVEKRTHEINTSQHYKTTSNFMFKPKNLNWETHTRNNNNNSNLYTKIYSPWIDPQFGRNITLPYTKDVKKTHNSFRVTCRFPIRRFDSFAKSKAVSFNWTLEEVTACRVDHDLMKGIAIFVQKWT